MNSIVFSLLFSLLFGENNFRSDFLQRYIDTAKEYGLYPIRGVTDSWKTTVMSKLFNLELLLRLTIK